MKNSGFENGRRQLLTACAAGVATLAGCAGMSSESNSNQPTLTPTPTSTPTPKPAEFEVVRFDVPRKVEAGDVVTIKVSVRNIGGQTGPFDSQLILTDDTDTQTLSLGGMVPPGETQLTESFVTERPGEIAIELSEYDYSATIRVTTPTPQVLQMNPVSEWSAYGDLEEHKLEEPSASEGFLLAYRTEIWVHNGSLDKTDQLRIFNSDGERVYEYSQDDESLTDSSGLTGWEWAFSIPPDTLTQGTYSFEIITRDNIGNITSEPLEQEFVIYE